MPIYLENNLPFITSRLTTYRTRGNYHTTNYRILYTENDYTGPYPYQDDAANNKKYVLKHYNNNSNIKKNSYLNNQISNTNNTNIFQKTSKNTLQYKNCLRNYNLNTYNHHIFNKTFPSYYSGIKHMIPS
tara:strand:+ start:240 stop:629 length:390 start_codon:yes stop_codon:yes gene_type:complete